MALIFQTKGCFSSSPSPFLFSTGGPTRFALHEMGLLGAWASGNIFSTTPMAMSSRPVPCCSVNGFVNIMYDSKSVTAFLAVVICTNY